VSRIGEALAPDLPGEARARDSLDPRAQRVLDAVPVRRAAPVESLAACCGLSVSTVSGALVVLERRGLVEQVDECWRLRPGAESR
jgi:DNA processing protein